MCAMILKLRILVASYDDESLLLLVLEDVEVDVGLVSGVEAAKREEIIRTLLWGANHALEVWRRVKSRIILLMIVVELCIRIKGEEKRRWKRQLMRMEGRTITGPIFQQLELLRVL